MYQSPYSLGRGPLRVHPVPVHEAEERRHHRRAERGEAPRGARPAAEHLVEVPAGQGRRRDLDAPAARHLRQEPEVRVARHDDGARIEERKGTVTIGLW